MRCLASLLLAAALSAALAGCVSTTYETAPADKGAQGPLIVHLEGNRGIRAFGRSFSSARELAGELERHGAKFSNRGGPDPVVLRCENGATLEFAQEVRKNLVRNGIPAVTIQGPRTVSARVTE